LSKGYDEEYCEETEIGETMTTLFDLPKESIPRLNQCYLCKSWHLEEGLHPIEVPDQAGYVKKLGCQKCLDQIMGQSGFQDGPQAGEKEKQRVRDRGRS
jgi:hypothetical protein